MDNFTTGRKGIFLTNTRHAYKGIKDRNNKLYWNCGTFFHQLNPDETYSIRIHNVNLYFEGKKNLSPDQVKTTEGTENYNMKWVRMQKGKWDNSFNICGNKPVAFDLKDTPFGNTPYIGNHMLNAAPGQIIYDAYDGLIFLAPLDSLRMSALTDKIYTPEFNIELERRYKILETSSQINDMLKESGCSTLTEYIKRNYKYEPVKISPLIKMLGPIDEWEK
jgi:hypothetical protein